MGDGYVEAESPTCFNIQNFIDELIEVFDWDAAQETLPMQ